MLLRATAAGSALRGTMSPTEACHAGAASAVPQPTRKVKASSSQGVSHPLNAYIVSAIDTASINSCADSMMRRRSRLSATAPAHKDKNTIGRAVDDWTSAISWGESRSEEHTSETPVTNAHLVCRLLLEK